MKMMLCYFFLYFFVKNCNFIWRLMTDNKRGTRDKMSQPMTKIY